MADIRLSVVTPCYNSAGSIEETLKSVENQSRQPYEHIIIDGGSSDGTLDILADYEKRTPYEVRIVSEPDNGIYDAMNKGIRLSTGDLIGIINSDDRYEAGALDAIADAYTGDAHEIIYGMIRTLDDGMEKTIEFYHHEFLLDRMINHPGCFVTKECYDDYGLFDTKFRSSADYDWMKRAMDGGAVFTPVHMILADMAIGGMSSSNQGFRETLKLQYEWGRVSRARYLAYTFKSYAGDAYRKLTRR